MAYSRKRNRKNNPPAITINGQMLETVPTLKYLGLLLSSDFSWTNNIEGIAMHQSKENFRSLIPSILPAHWPGDSSPTISIQCQAPHGVRSTSLGPTREKIRIYLKALRSLHVTKNWDKGYDELLYDKQYPLCRQKVDCDACTKLCTTWLTSHQMLLYLKSLDRIPTHLLPCTSLLHILIVFFL